MRHQAEVGDIMATKPIALKRSDTLEIAEALFNQYQIKHIPVVSHDVVIGMVSFTDLQRIGQPEVSADEHDINTVVYNTFTIEQVMTKNVVTVPSNTPVNEAAQILAEREFHALPVVDDGILVGMVTTTDLLKYYIKVF